MKSVGYFVVRIVTKKLHRAFPELDPFDDDQCLRFVKRARQGFGKLISGVVLILLVTLPLLLAGLYVTVLAFEKLRIELYWPGIMSMATLKWILIAAPSMGIGPACGYIVRDFLLRRWIKRILRIQGVCPSCMYNLLGLPLDENSAVQCPECGLKSVVDPSLGELKLDEKGRPIAILDGKRMVRKSTPWLWKWTKRGLIAAAIFLFVILPGAAGIWEYSIRSQANRAKADLTLLEQAAKDLIVKIQTAPAGPSVWPPIDRAAQSLSQTVSNLQAKIGPNVYRYLEPELLSPSEAARRHAEEEFTQFDGGTTQNIRLHLLEFVATLESNGTFEALDTAADRGCTLPWDDFATASFVNGTLPVQGLTAFYSRDVLVNSYQLQATCLVRMSLGVQRGDLPLAIRGLREALAVNRAIADIPASRFGRYDGMTLRWATLSLLLHEKPEWATALRAEFQKQWRPEPNDAWIEGTRLQALIFIADYFSIPENSRLGRYSPAFQENLKTYSPGNRRAARLGTYRENVDLVNDYFDALQSHLSTGNPASTFVWTKAGPGLPFYVGIWTQGHTWQTRLEYHRRALWEGFCTVCALVEFKGANGRYPNDLKELVPKFLPQPLVDPFSGKPYEYSITACGRDGAPIRYRLLSVGPNGVLDVPNPGPPISPAGSYTDDIIIVDGYDDLP